MQTNKPLMRSRPSISECALLVLSCDFYSDLWPPFFTLLRTHWSDCPFPVFLGSGPLGQPPDQVTILRSSAGRDWSQCLLDYISQIDSEYLLLVLDDFFLRSKVDTERVMHCLRFAQAEQAAQVRLVARPGPTVRLPGESIVGLCGAAVRYRVCAQAAIWRKEALRALLVPGESAWEFEEGGTVRAASQEDEHYAVWRSVLPYEGLWAHHVIEKGCWLPHEKWIFSRKQISCDFQKRPTLSLKRTVFYHAARMTQSVINSLPIGMRNRTRQVIRSVAARVFPRQVRLLGGK